MLRPSLTHLSACAAEEKAADLKLLEAPAAVAGVSGKTKTLVPRPQDADDSGDEGEESSSDDDEVCHKKGMADVSPKWGQSSLTRWSMMLILKVQETVPLDFDNNNHSTSCIGRVIADNVQEILFTSGHHVGHDCSQRAPLWI